MDTILNTGVLLSYDSVRSSCTRLREYGGFELWLNQDDKNATIVIVLVSRSYATYNDVQLVPFMGYIASSRYQAHIVDFISSNVDIRDLEHNSKEIAYNKEKVKNKVVDVNSGSEDSGSELHLELFSGSFNRYILKCTYKGFEFWKSALTARSCICIRYIGRSSSSIKGMQVTRYAVYSTNISSIALLQSYIRKLVEFS